MKVYTIYDRKAKLGMQLFCAENLEVAKRILRSSLKADSQLVLYPSDYLLKELGVYDADNCKLTGTESCSFSEVKVLIPDSFRQYCLDGTFEGVD